jgi:DNA-binding transcriptional MerR regulator
METTSVDVAGTRGPPAEASAQQTMASCHPEAHKEYRFTIGDLSREFGLSLRALRFYEDRGLLQPHRRGTTRLYSDSDRSRLQLILKGKQLGFTLAEIRELMAAQAEARELLDLALTLNPEQITAQIDLLERQRAELEIALSELRAAQQRAQTSGARLTA